MTIQVPDSIFQLYKDQVELFNTSMFGTDCILYYPDERTECPNCIVNPVTQESTNQYKSGGPIEFSNGECPYCNGSGFVSQQPSENLQMRVYFEKKTYAKLGVTANMAQADVLTYGNIENMAKCLRCQEIEIAGQRYVLTGQPILRGLKRKDFFLAAWELKK